MTTPWRKTIRDFQQESTRTLLVAAAIAIGIIAFSAILSTYAVLTRELDKGYRATNPASATLHTDAIDDALVTAVLSDRDVSNAEPRRTVSGSIKVGAVQWRNLVLFVAEDYPNMRLGKIVPEQGAWPPATGEMLMERDAFQVARAKIGDTVTIKITTGKEQTLRLSGQVHDVGQAQARMENSVYGYITLATLVQLGEQPYLDQLKILVAENRLDERHIRTVAADVKNLLESRGHPVREIDVPQPGKHPHNDLMGVLLLTMAAFGLLVLAMSGILVLNLLLAIMASQVRQIGMMKAIGGSRGQIARIYLGQALLLGIAATLVAIPLGILAGRVLTRAFARLLNFDIVSFAIPLWVFALVFAAGVMVPLLAACWPVWKGTALPVREAMCDYGTSRNVFGSGILDRSIAAIGGGLRPLLLAIRNSFRRRARLALTLATLVVSGVFFLTALNIRSSMMRSVDHICAARRYDIEVVFDGMFSSEKIDRAVRKTPGVASAENWFMSGASIPGSGSTGGSNAGPPNPHSGNRDAAIDAIRFPLIALPANSKMIKLQISDGRDLVPGDNDAIVISSALAERSHLKPGDTVTLRMGPALTTWHVVGISREGFFATIAYIPEQFVEQYHPGQRTSVALKLEKTDAQSIYAVTTALDSNLRQEGIRVMDSRSQIDRRTGVDQHILMIYVFLVIMAGIILFVGGLGLATTMSLNVMERRRETGILRVLGASPRLVMGIVATEGTVVGAMSWIGAALAAGPVSRVAGNSLMALLFKSKMDFVFQLQGLWIWFAIAVVLSAIASLAPARSAAKLTVREALAYE